MLRRDRAGVERVAADGREFFGWLVDEDDVQSVERGRGKCGRGDAGDDHAIYLTVAQRLEVLHDLGALRLPEEHGVSGLRRHLLGTGDDSGVNRIVVTRNDRSEEETFDI